MSISQPEPTRHQQVSETAQRMLELGESGRYEFKRDVDKVSVRLLATLANWVALDPDREVAHLLVGVEEVEDELTGLVRGQPYGLPKGLDRAVARIQDVASKTKPIPVDAFIVEEGVAEATPFIRVEVRPTMAPHFDDEGRRQTRQGRSTRALTDDELLRIYLDREAGSFAARFRQISHELRSAVGAVGSQVDQIAAGIESHIAQPIYELTNTTTAAADAADSAASSADSASYEVEHVRRLVGDLHTVVTELQDESVHNMAYRVVQERRKVWWAFTVDTWEHDSKLADTLESRLLELLSSDVPLDAARNSWELEIWSSLLDGRRRQRREHGTQKWWDEMTRVVLGFMENPSYAAPELPDLRSALKADLEHEVEDPESATNLFRQLLAPR